MIDTDSDFDRIRRRRECVSCGNKWYTVEIDEDTLHNNSVATQRLIDAAKSALVQMVKV